MTIIERNGLEEKSKEDGSKLCQIVGHMQTKCGTRKEKE